MEVLWLGWDHDWRVVEILFRLKEGRREGWMREWQERWGEVPVLEVKLGAGERRMSWRLSGLLLMMCSIFEMGWGMRVRDSLCWLAAV